MGIQNILSAISGKPIITNEEPKTGAVFAFFWGRVVMSVAILGFCLACTLAALFQGKTSIKAKHPPSERGTSMFGKMTCDLLFKGNGANLPGFMIGRQLTVVASFFLVGSITSMNIVPGTGENIFGVSDSAQASLNYGFQGAVITTILASITWQLAASAFPISSSTTRSLTSFWSSPSFSSSLASVLVLGCARAS